MKLSDYIADFLAKHGVTHAFGMSGGAAVHMFDSIDRHPGMRIVSMTHEQGAAMAADGYARATGRLGVAVTTSGPGATNLLTGTCCSFYDSIPTLMLTGQVATHRLKGERQVRQVGFQETDVVSIFAPVTKYAVQLKDAQSIRYHLERAYYTAFEGRPGPVLLDVPDNLQREEVDPASLESFVPPEAAFHGDLHADVQALLRKLGKAERPLLVLGGGLKTPDVGDMLVPLLQRLGVPALVSWAGLDLLPHEHPLRVGTFGVYGPRAGNFAVQNADLIVALGTRLSQNLTGGILNSFAREAHLVMVDADAHEMSKFDGRGIVVHQRIHARCAAFLAELGRQLPLKWNGDRPEWREHLQHWRRTFRPDPSPRAAVNHSYVSAPEFVEQLSEALPERARVFADTGGNLTWTCNAFKPKRDQRLYSAWNNTPMGYALPAAIGACFSDPSRHVSCLIGDGGLMLCLGELATLVRHQLPVRVFLFNNHSHGIQKQTLETWLNGRFVGVDPGSGLAFPQNFERVAEAMGLVTFRIDGTRPMTAVFAEIAAVPGPVFVNVEINPDEKLFPFLKFGQPLENQAPLLPPRLVEEEMIIAPYDPTKADATARQQAGQGW